MQSREEYVLTIATPSLDVCVGPAASTEGLR